jgi:hypothetical protein
MAGGPNEVAEYIADLCSEMQQITSQVCLMCAQPLAATALDAQRYRKKLSALLRDVLQAAAGARNKNGPEAVRSHISVSS